MLKKTTLSSFWEDDFKASVVCAVVVLADTRVWSLAACVGDVTPWEDEVDPERIYSSVPKARQSRQGRPVLGPQEGLVEWEEIGPGDPLVSHRAQLSVGTCSDTRVTRGVT